MGKIKVRTLFKWIFIVLIILECEFGYMVNVGAFSNPEFVKIFRMFLCVMTYFLYKQIVHNYIVSKEIRYIITLFMLLIPLNFIVSMINGINALDALLGISHYFYMLLIEPIAFTIEDSKIRRQLVGCILVLGSISVALRAYMSIYYHLNNHAILFPLLSLAAGTKERFNSILGYNMLRVYPSCFGNVLIILCFCITLVAKKMRTKIASFAVVVLLMIYYILVYQARAYTVIFGIELFFMFISMKYKRNKSIKSLVKYLVAFLLIVIAVRSSYVSELLNSFSTTSVLGESTSIRLEGIKYILLKILTTFPFGIGSSGGFESPMGLVYVDDYGFLDFVVKNNILGLLVYIVLISYLIGKTYAARNTSCYIYMLACVLIIIGGMAAVDNFLPRKIGAIPFVVAYFEVFYQMSTKRRLEGEKGQLK